MAVSVKIKCLKLVKDFLWRLDLCFVRIFFTFWLFFIHSLLLDIYQFFCSFLYVLLLFEPGTNYSFRSHMIKLNLKIHWKTLFCDLSVWRWNLWPKKFKLCNCWLIGKPNDIKLRKFYMISMLILFFFFFAYSLTIIHDLEHLLCEEERKKNSSNH